MIERRKWAAIPGLLALAAAAVMLSAYSGASSSKNSSPDQPIAFPHPVHVQKLGLNCVYCHSAANKSPDPGMPALETCMGCHAVVGPERPAIDGQPKRTSEELKKLWHYAGIENQMEALTQRIDTIPNAGDTTIARPIPWVRIHKVPEYVRFPHMRHVNAGVTCQSCHGQVQKMDKVFQAQSLNMGWCVSCHVNGYSPAEGLEAAGYAPVAGAGATPAPPTPSAERKKARYDCSNCHY
jgi:hypothetical protein